MEEKIRKTSSVYQVIGHTSKEIRYILIIKCNALLSVIMMLKILSFYLSGYRKLLRGTAEKLFLRSVFSIKNTNTILFTLLKINQLFLGLRPYPVILSLGRCLAPGLPGSPM